MAAVDLDRPDPEDLGTAGDWLGDRVTLLLVYTPSTDTVRIDRGTFPKSLAKAVLGKAWSEDENPVTWGEPPEEWDEE